MSGDRLGHVHQSYEGLRKECALARDTIDMAQFVPMRRVAGGPASA